MSGKWGPVPWLGIEPGPPEMGVQSLSHQTTREVPKINDIYSKSFIIYEMLPEECPGFTVGYDKLQGSPGCASGKESTCQCRRHKRWEFDP